MSIKHALMTFFMVCIILNIICMKLLICMTHEPFWNSKGVTTKPCNPVSRCSGRGPRGPRVFFAAPAALAKQGKKLGHSMCSPAPQERESHFDFCDPMAWTWLKMLLSNRFKKPRVDDFDTIWWCSNCQSFEGWVKNDVYIYNIYHIWHLNLEPPSPDHRTTKLCHSETSKIWRLPLPRESRRYHYKYTFRYWQHLNPQLVTPNFKRPDTAWHT